MTIDFRALNLTSRETYKTGGNELGRDHSAGENGNSSRFPGTRRSTSSELVRTSRKRQRFGSTVEFYS